MHLKPNIVQQVILIVYFNVCGGPLGSETIFSACGPLIGLISLFVSLVVSQRSYCNSSMLLAFKIAFPFFILHFPPLIRLWTFLCVFCGCICVCLYAHSPVFIAAIQHQKVWCVQQSLMTLELSSAFPENGLFTRWKLPA